MASSASSARCGGCTCPRGAAGGPSAWAPGWPEHEASGGRGAQRGADADLLLGRQVDLRLHQAGVTGKDLSGTEALKELEDLGVVREAVGREVPDSLLERPCGQPLEQLGGDATPLPVVNDRHGHLGSLRVLLGAHEARHADRLTALPAECDERLVVVVVDLGEVAHQARAEPWHRHDEALLARFRAHMLDSVEQALLVALSNRADRDLRAVAKRDALRPAAL